MAVYKASNSGLLTRTEYSSFLAGNEQFIPWAPSGAYDSIATTTVGSGGAASITFSSIPATYTHLQIRAFARTNRSAVADYALVRFNSDTTSANYRSHYLDGDGTTAASYDFGNASGVLFQRFGAANASASIFGAGILDLLDYQNANKYKTIRNLGGTDTNGGGTIDLGSGVWLSTSAVTSITIAPGGGTLFNEYSSFALYGIKGGN